MSAISDRIEALAAFHNRNPLHLLEMYLERLSIMQSDSIPDAERLALEDVERELEGRS